MDHSFRASSRRSYDLPKPDADLTDWTSKIKAIQRQADADEDTEQKRLEEEIAAARQARLRRRSRTPNRADSADLSNRELVGVLGNTFDTSNKDTPKSPADTYHDRETALRKLMDRNSVYNPDKRGTNEGISRPDSVSLASFLGGRANGPRLNRHAPQPDAHDPAQFIQPDLSAPHPIFGTGGVALPGKTAEREKSPSLLAGSEMSERYRPASASALNPQFSSAVKHEVGKLDNPAKQEKVTTNRRSSTVLTQRYTNNLDKSTPDTSTKGTQPLLIKRKSGTFPKESLLPSPTKGDSTFTTSVSPSKSTSYPSSSSWKTSQSTPNPAPSYLRTKSSSSIPSAPTAKTSSSVDEGLPTSPSIKSFHEPTSRGSTIPIPTYSLPRNGISSSNHGATPLRRLMEKNNIYNPDRVPTDNFGKSVAERVQTTSLAAFMGGSGKGIRLNKHAPQVDAHDPTQYIQPDLSTPHPIFGKGGVAMPGMVTQTNASNPDSGIDGTGLSKPSFTKKAVWPPVSAPSKTEEGPVSPQKTGGRARTISAPRPESPSGYGISQSSKPFSGRSRSPAKVPLVGVPLRERTFSTPSRASLQQSIAPALARPIQPQVKNVPSLSPQVYATTPSPAFNKATAQKDLTPSLSRLQGRGFVQNMVKASSRISNSPSPPSASPSRPASTTGRKGSVLDRWQPNVQPESPTKSSPPLLSKNATSGSFGSSYDLKSSASFSSLTKPAPVSSSPPKQVGASYPRSRTPGLGSATTMVVIKPSKSFTDLTELGIKTAADSESSTSRKTSIYVR